MNAAMPDHQAPNILRLLGNEPEGHARCQGTAAAPVPVDLGEDRDAAYVQPAGFRPAERVFEQSVRRSSPLAQGEKVRASLRRGGFGALGALAVVRVQNHLAQPDRFRRHLDQLVLLDIGEGALQGEL